MIQRNNDFIHRDPPLEMHVLFCQPTLQETGSEHSLLEILKGVEEKNQGLRLAVLAGEDGPMAKHYKKHADLFVVPAPKLRRRWGSVLPHLASYIRVYRWVGRLKRNNPNLIVYINTLMFPQALIAGRIHRLPVYVHVREVATTYPFPIYLTYFTLAALMSRRIVAACHYIFQQKLGPIVGPIAKRKGIVIYNASDFPIPTMIDVSKPRILSVIPVTLRKGILDLACCVDTLHSRYPDLEFTVDIVGRIDDLELYQKIKIFLQDANCINHINFHGPMSRKLLTAMYRDSSILVHPSRSEAFPRVLVEAMNYGLPCVTTNAGGSSEAVVDGDTGFVVPVGNWQEMAERLALLLKDYTLRKKMATAAIARYRRWFSRSAMSSDILKILDEISHSQGEELNVHTRH